MLDRLLEPVTDGKVCLGTHCIELLLYPILLCVICFLSPSSGGGGGGEITLYYIVLLSNASWESFPTLVTQAWGCRRRTAHRSVFEHCKPSVERLIHAHSDNCCVDIRLWRYLFQAVNGEVSVSDSRETSAANSPPLAAGSKSGESDAVKSPTLSAPDDQLTAAARVAEELQPTGFTLSTSKVGYACHCDYGIGDSTTYMSLSNAPWTEVNARPYSIITIFIFILLQRQLSVKVFTYSAGHQENLRVVRENMYVLLANAAFLN